MYSIHMGCVYKGEDKAYQLVSNYHTRKGEIMSQACADIGRDYSSILENAKKHLF